MRHGILYSFAILFNRFVPAWLFRLGYWHILELERNRLIAAQQRTSDDSNAFVVIKKVGRSEADELCAVTGAGKLRDNTVGYAIRLDELGIVGGAWVSSQAFAEPDLGITIKLRSDQSWLFSAKVSKPHRGKGLYKACLIQIAKDLSDEDRLLCAVNPFNRRSAGLHGSFSRMVRGRLIVVRFLGLAFALADGDLVLSARFSSRCQAVPICVRVATNPTEHC